MAPVVQCYLRRIEKAARAILKPHIMPVMGGVQSGFGFTGLLLRFYCVRRKATRPSTSSSLNKNLKPFGMPSE